MDWEMPDDDPANPFHCVDSLPDCAERLGPGDLTNGSCCDPRDKIVLVEKGHLRLEAPHGKWRLPLAHMVFVRHGHPDWLRTDASSSITVAHLGAQHAGWQHEDCWTARISGLAREMLCYALRWGRERARDDAIADTYFAALDLLYKRWFKCSWMMWVPFSESPGLKRAVAYARTRLDLVTIKLAAEAAWMLVRTLRRRFQDEPGMIWRRFLQELGMSRAIELLTHNRLPVKQTALEVGFGSVAAFRLAFAAVASKTPSSYMRNFLDSPLIPDKESQSDMQTAFITRM